MPRSDREVFDKLTGGADFPGPLPLIAYALFARERREWIRHREQSFGRAPEPDEVEDWITNLTEWQFAQMEAQAAGYFDAAAHAYLADEIEARERAALESALVREVRAAGAFWKQFAIALLTSILAPIIIGGVIALSLVYSDRFPSIRDLSGVRGLQSDRP